MARSPANLDDAVKLLTELVDLSRVANTLAAANHVLLRRAAFPQAGATRPPPPPTPGGAGAPVPAPLPPAAATYPVLPPVQLPTTAAPTAPAAGQAAPTPNQTAAPRRGPWGRLWERVKGGIKNRIRGSRPARMARQGRVLGRATGVAGGGAAGAVLGGVAGAAGAVVSGFTLLSRVTGQLSDQQLAWAKHLADAGSGSMAAIMAEQEMKDMLRDIKRGEDTSGTAADLAESSARRKDAWAPIGTALDDMVNTVATWGNNLISTVLEPIGDAIDSIRDAVGGEKKEPEAFGLAAMEADIKREADRIAAAGARLMAAARAAAGGVAAPAGAARPGALP